MRCPHGYSRKSICHKCLEPRNFDIFILRTRGITYRAIGEKYHLSLERVRQIVSKQERVQFRKVLKTFQEFTRTMKRLRAVRNNVDVDQVQILHSAGLYNPELLTTQKGEKT